jgi:DNA-binding PadR family transcriptional regulator
MTVRGTLLSLLAEGDRHGYQLKVDFEERTGGLWPLNVGQVYTTLDRMLRDDAVAERKSGNPDQRVFGITETGRRELKEWLTTTPVDGAPPRDEFVMKILIAVQTGGKAGLELLDIQRGALLGALQQGRRQMRLRGAASDSVNALAHDALLGRIEADINWLERCEEHLRAQTKANKR